MILAALAALTIGATSPRYSLLKQNGAWWFVGPDKKPFFSLGVCCVTTGETFLGDDPKNPSYAAYRYYPTGKQAWAEDTIDRLQSWNFNTIGAWSDANTLKQVKAPDMHFTPILHMGSGAGAPWRDMWDPKIVGMMNDIARDQIKEFHGDPRVIGYFSDNEQGWWYGALFDWAWKGPYTREKLVDLLQKRYKDWTSLTKDFEPVQAKDFAGLRKSGRLYLRTGGNGIQAVDAYMEMLANRYYSLCNAIIKKYDSAALYLGDRYISNFYPGIVRAAGKSVDVLSTNLNADWNDGSFTPFYLPSIHRLARKPVMVTEYYMCATENRTGNKNDSSGFPVVQTQAERARGFLTSTRTLLNTPYVVGAHWFQYYDEPQNGRGDGENYDFGLVDVNNDPYEELVHAAQSLNLSERTASTIAVTKTVPEIAPGDGPNLERWPRQEAYWQPTRPSDRGDTFVAWTNEAAYIAVYWNEDRFGEALYNGGKVPESEEPLLTVNWPSKKASIRLIDKKSKISGVVELASLKMGVRNLAVVKIPASALGSKELTPGTKLTFDIVLQTRSRAQTIRWTATKSITN